jgi:hypothetical protein
MVSQPTLSTCPQPSHDPICLHTQHPLPISL